MEVFEKDIIPQIEAIYGNLTPIEKTIADFFINNKEVTDLSARHVSSLLFVSEASLSRFSKKCGFKGYREFLFNYEKRPSKEHEVENDQIKTVLNTYQELLNKSYSLVDENQMQRLVDLFSRKKRFYVYGRGSSGTVAQEMKFRFMRMGVNMEAVTDTHVMKMNQVILDEDCVAIGISVSGRELILNALKAAKKAGATTILMTSHKDKSVKKYCDETVLFAVKENLEKGMVISPQFPILVMVDILFSRILESDKFRREALYDSTLHALDDLEH